ncbi:hypothetical protein D3C86_1529670 [compost metagenome]
MADEQIGHPQLLAQVAQQFENRCTDHGIQCRGHLVAENQIRLGCEGPGQIDPLFLPAGQFVRTTFSHRARQTNEIQQLTDTLAQSRTLEAEIHLQRATQNSADAVHRVECGVGILEDHLNASELLVGARRQAATQRLAIEGQPAESRLQQPGHHPRQSRLART